MITLIELLPEKMGYELSNPEYKFLNPELFTEIQKYPQINFITYKQNIIPNQVKTFALKKLNGRNLASLKICPEKYKIPSLDFFPEKNYPNGLGNYGRTNEPCIGDFIKKEQDCLDEYLSIQEIEKRLKKLNPVWNFKKYKKHKKMLKEANEILRKYKNFKTNIDNAKINIDTYSKYNPQEEISKIKSMQDIRYSAAFSLAEEVNKKLLKEYQLS